MKRDMKIESFVYGNNQAGWIVVVDGKKDHMFLTERQARDFVRVFERIEEYAREGIWIENDKFEALQTNAWEVDTPIPPRIKLESFQYRDNQVGWMVIVDGKDEAMFTTEDEARAFARAYDQLNEQIRTETTH
jgi:hypothetical protein